jgi:hypothetical protein
MWSLFDRETSARLYPVKLAEVVRAIADAVEHPPEGVRVIEAPEMRLASGSRSPQRHSTAEPQPKT